MAVPKADRIFYLKYAFYAGCSVSQIADITKIDPWFLTQIEDIIHFESLIKKSARSSSLSA